MELALIMVAFFTFLAIVYVAVVIFAPEWVGIQGKAAQAIEASHKKDSDEP